MVQLPPRGHATAIGRGSRTRQVHRAGGRLACVEQRQPVRQGGRVMAGHPVRRNNLLGTGTEQMHHRRVVWDCPRVDVDAAPQPADRACSQRGPESFLGDTERSDLRRCERCVRNRPGSSSPHADTVTRCRTSDHARQPSCGQLCSATPTARPPRPRDPHRYPAPRCWRPAPIDLAPSPRGPSPGTRTCTQRASPPPPATVPLIAAGWAPDTPSRSGRGRRQWGAHATARMASLPGTFLGRAHGTARKSPSRGSRWAVPCAAVGGSRRVPAHRGGIVCAAPFTRVARDPNPAPRGLVHP